MAYQECWLCDACKLDGPTFYTKEEASEHERKCHAFKSSPSTSFMSTNSDDVGYDSEGTYFSMREIFRSADLAACNAPKQPKSKQELSDESKRKKRLSIRRIGSKRGHSLDDKMSDKSTKSIRPRSPMKAFKNMLKQHTNHQHKTVKLRNSSSMTSLSTMCSNISDDSSIRSNFSSEMSGSIHGHWIEPVSQENTLPRSESINELKEMISNDYQVKSSVLAPSSPKRVKMPRLSATRRNTKTNQSSLAMMEQKDDVNHNNTRKRDEAPKALPVRSVTNHKGLNGRLSIQDMISALNLGGLVEPGPASTTTVKTIAKSLSASYVTKKKISMKKKMINYDAYVSRCTAAFRRQIVSDEIFANMTRSIFSQHKKLVRSISC